MTLEAQIADLRFEAEWSKKKVNLLNVHVGELEGMVELVIDRFMPYSLGDTWTQEDMIVVRDLQQQLEEMVE